MNLDSPDYSRPEFKTMFANYGLAALSAAGLEKHLLLLISAIDHLGKETLPKNVLYAYLEKHRKTTLGQLIINLSKRVHIPSAMDSTLKDALEKRNTVVHNFFFEQYETMILPDGPTLLSNRLRPINELFRLAITEVDNMLEKVLVQTNKPRNKISPEVRKMLKGKWAI